jgi:hypothetical protein
MRGSYYFDLAREYLKKSPLTTADLKIYINKAGAYFTEGNIKNALPGYDKMPSGSLVERQNDSAAILA